MNKNKKSPSLPKRPLIVRFQKLLQDKKGNFPWSKMISEKEVSFIYDMVSMAEINKHFTLTPAQAEWSIAILNKIDTHRKKSKRKKNKATHYKAI